MEKEVKIGVSELPIIMGKVSWMTPQQLWRIKVGIEQKKDPTLPMMVGRYLEEPIFQMYCDLMGWDYSSFEKQKRVVIYPWLTGHIDFYSTIDNGVYEVKALSQLHNIDGYLIQLNTYMYATNSKVGYLIALVNNYNLHVIEHEYDQSMAEAALEAARDFYEKVINRIPPEPIAIAADAPKSLPSNEYASIAEAIKEVSTLSEQIKDLEQRQKQLKEYIQGTLAASNVSKLKTPFGTASIVTTTRKSLDETRLREVVQNLDEFYKETEFSYLKVTPTKVRKL